MAVSRYCPHGNLRVTCLQCRLGLTQEAEARAAVNRARGESGRISRIEGFDLPYPWQREAFEAWSTGGRTGLVALSLGVPAGDLPYAVMAEAVNGSPGTNVLLACPLGEGDSVREELQKRFRLSPTTLLDHHFLEPRDDGSLVVADLAELETIDLASWGRFASNGLLVLLDADGVNPHLGQFLLDTPFRHRFSLSRQPSAIDLLVSRPWVRAFGPLLYRYTEDQARDVGILPRIRYRLHVEMLRPDPDDVRGPEGPWEPNDIPTRLPPVQAGAFVRGRARDVALRRAQAQPGLVVVHDGVPVPGALATLRLPDLPDRHAEPPSGWLLATPNADGRSILRLATVAFKTLGQPGAVEDAVVLPVPADLCRVPPWNDKWRLAAGQIDRAVAGLLLAEKPGEAMAPEDLESLVGVALALRGLPADELTTLTPVVAEAAEAAHAGKAIPPDRVREAARAYGSLASALLVAAAGGPLALLRLAHPRFTPVQPDLPHPSLYDARRHAWRGRAFAALAQAAHRADLVTTWGRHPELRFVFPSSSLLEAATAYCQLHKLRGPLDDADVKPIEDRTRIAAGDRTRAKETLQVWNDALALAEVHEREFLADLHTRQPERERRREGMALPALAVLEQGPESVSLESREGRLPNTNISPGCEVALVEAGGRAELGRGLVSRISARRVVIDFPGGAPRHLPREVTVNLVFDAKVFEAYHAAVLAAVRSIQATAPLDDGPDGLLRCALLGEEQARDPVRQAVSVPGLTPSQTEAITATLSGGRVRLIHGPPGTGKTHTLVHLAMALTRAGHSVLVTADSNAAVDNMVVGLRRSGALVVRIGHAPNLRDPEAEPARIDPLDAPPFVRWAAEQGIVVATTNYGAFRYIDPKGGMTPFIFDYVIHDEAGQATAPSSLAAMLRGRRLILAGDPKQLPPTVVSMDAKEAGLDVTLFERIEELTGRSRTTLLRTQFRMREPILAFSNERYYDGQVETAPSAAEQEGLPDLPALAFQHVTGRENERQRSGSISNDFEVDAVAAIVERLRNEARDRGWTMAVLTPYQAQREALRRRLPDMEVSTVDGAQGREWDIVLYSSVRSNPQHRLGFVSDERRLNVAVTRARRHFILVGDERTLRDQENFGQLLAKAEKVRLHYPPPERDQPQDRRGGRPHDRRGREPRRDGRHDGRQAARPEFRQGGPQEGRQDGREDGGRRRRRRRGRGGRGDGQGQGVPPGQGRPPEQARDGGPRQVPPPQQPRQQPDGGRRNPPDPVPLPPPAEADLPPRPPRRSYHVPGTQGDSQSAPSAPAAPAAPSPVPQPKPRPHQRTLIPAPQAPAPSASEAPKAEPSQETVAEAPRRAAKATRPKPSAPVASPAPEPAAKAKPAKRAAKKAAAAKPKAAKPAPAKAARKEAAPKAKAGKAAPAKGKPAKAGKAAGGGTCTAVTKAGTRCRAVAQPGSTTCARHS